MNQRLRNGVNRYQKQWRKEHPGKSSEYSKRYRAKVIQKAIEEALLANTIK